MPLALLTAIVVECVLVAVMLALAVFDAARGVTSLGHNIDNAAAAFGTGVGLLLLAFPLALGAFRLARRDVVGSQLSYIAAILVVLISVSTAIEAGEILLAVSLAVASVIVVLCLITPATRLALSPAVPAARAEANAVLPSPIGMRGYPPPELRLSQSRRDTALMLLGGIAFVVAGTWMGLSGLVVGWMCVGVFGAATIAIFSMWLRGYPKMTATPEGLRVTNFAGWRTYPWERVGPFAAGSVGRNVRRVIFTLAPSNARPSAPISISRALAGMDARLPSNFGMDPDELAAALNSWKDWSVGGS
jgi:hypothetical protein